MIYLKRLIFITLITTSCQSTGQLSFEADLASNLKEVSGTEISIYSKLIWVIEDAGNSTNLYGLNIDGQIVKTVKITNALNKDWEDLTTDSKGNIYIGDFGNNNKKRKKFTIYKINYNDLSKEKAEASAINFQLPKDLKSRDFEAFFLYNNAFYIFSKEAKTFSVLQVPNVIGNHIAILKSSYNFNGDKNKITAADISADGKTIVLLNHNKIWKLTDYKTDDFFSGSIENITFKHNSQKEGLCFKTNTTVLITDERNKSKGGNMYSFNLN
ncbi:MAG: hypothetical protein ABF246_02545 [Winogradskyella sp.]